MTGSWGIHWFRRDLRIPANHALQDIWRETNGRTLGVFCFDSKFLGRSDFSANRFAFFLQALLALRAEFLARGGDLLVVDEQPLEFFSRLMALLQEQGRPQPKVVSWNRDYEPFARKRDSEVAALVESYGIKVLSRRDHLIFEPEELEKEEGGYYQVYGPFRRKWMKMLMDPAGATRIVKGGTLDVKTEQLPFSGRWKELGPSGLKLLDRLDYFAERNNSRVTIPIPEGGFGPAVKQLKAFARKLFDYGELRDRPDLPGTSRLSMFLKNGSITTSQVIHFLGMPDSGAEKFLNELVWREFYYHILYHRPDSENAAFVEKYDHLSWSDREDLFARWKEGTTGFPIVDAGMRELTTTGFMHNRVRMIVASFLVKDLLIDWRWGANFFMKELLDGDLAANCGGWQWAASTGCDPQPYFRIFNPWLQSKKFDPQGHYIRTYVPELRGILSAALHDPRADRSKHGYPRPIVDHAEQREKALGMFRGVSGLKPLF